MVLEKGDVYSQILYYMFQRQYFSNKRNMLYQFSLNKSLKFNAASNDNKRSVLPFLKKFKINSKKLNISKRLQALKLLFMLILE